MTQYFIRILIGMMIFTNANAQPLTQTLRGTVVEMSLQTPVEGATVTIGRKTALTDAAGNFRINEVPVGSYTIQVSHVAYNELQLDNIALNSGKELVLTLSLEERKTTEQEVVIRAAGTKNRPLNELSMVSARAFTVEETRRYAAAVNDPLRMATAFPGVVNTSDGQNNISIRGNAPTGLLWRMEGIDIPNPNHFGMAGASGGGISILSAQLLSNSDFVTGAFAAEYGNALSGVFDLRLRKGNNEKQEYTIEAGVLGLNVAAEGPFSKSYKGSYLFNYRYSTLSLLSKMGLDMGAGTTDFQDLSYNISLPAGRMGTFSVFGFTGLSSQNMSGKEDISEWESEGDRYSGRFVSNTVMNGVTHQLKLGTSASLRSALAYSSASQRYDEYYAETDKTKTNSYRDDNTTRRLVLSSTLNYRIHRQQLVRAGFILSSIGYDYYQRSRENVNAPVVERINVNGSTQTMQAFAQWQFRPADNITFLSGFHTLWLLLNNTSSIDPRASVKWDINRRNSIAVAYGLHSQVQGMGVYFTRRPDINGTFSQPNRDLDLTRAHHLVLSYSRVLGSNLRLKAEGYYQHLIDVPVSVYDSVTFSTLNLEGGYVAEPLTNEGSGRNYGVELSLEKYFANNYYYLVNTSLYQSKYTASDKVERNTAFNGGHAINVTAGKEFVSSASKRVFGINVKAVHAGGLRTTPVDIESSATNGYMVLRAKEAFSLQNPAYFRTDLRISFKWNRQKTTNTISLDVQNMTNRQNIYTRIYDAFTGEMRNIYQSGIIPVLNYKIEF